MPKLPWRIQGDIAYGETDPIMTVFLGEPETDEDGVTTIRQDTRDPVTMPLSELVKDIGAEIVEPVKLRAAQAAEKQARRDAAAAALADAPAEPDVRGKA